MTSSIDFIFSDRGILPWRQEEARDQHADDTTYLIRIWEQLKPHRPEREGVRDVAARDDRLFINAVFWLLRTGAPWRYLPPDYGDSQRA